MCPVLYSVFCYALQCSAVKTSSAQYGAHIFSCSSSVCLQASPCHPGRWSHGCILFCSLLSSVLCSYFCFALCSVLSSVLCYVLCSVLYSVLCCDLCSVLLLLRSMLCSVLSSVLCLALYSLFCTMFYALFCSVINSILCFSSNRPTGPIRSSSREICLRACDFVPFPCDFLAWS